ncbi:metallophosphoesterase [Leptospira bandrabouensis]|nr:metallophosphoesterase [Leptospira bandrabouensis]MCG6161865.1 metallophosphoesterase [Leptospira bandrabouensis]
MAIGDIHSNYNALRVVLEKCQNYSEHKLIFLGDYFDYGNDLAKVIDVFMHLKTPSIFLLGNHEYEFFNFYEKYGTDRNSRDKILNHFGITNQHFQWLKDNLILSYENKTGFFSHAGLDDSKDIDDQSVTDLIYSGYRGNLDHVTLKQVVQGHLVMKKLTRIGNHIFTDTGSSLNGYLSCYMFPEDIVLTSKD